MIQFFFTLRRLFLALVRAWRRDPQFRSLTFPVAFTLLSGTLFYRTVEGWSAVDAFYFSVTTLTTVGLGDLTPATTFGKLFTVVYIFAGLGLLAGFINIVAQETLRSERSGRSNSEDDQNALGSQALTDFVGTPSTHMDA